MKTKKNNTCFGRYPACDLCNNALRFILAGKPDIAFEEIAQAIVKADGYFRQAMLISELNTESLRNAVIITKNEVIN